MKKIFWILALGALASASVAFALGRATPDAAKETR
jgi:hypothetical protein